MRHAAIRQLVCVLLGIIATQMISPARGCAEEPARTGKTYTLGYKFSPNQTVHYVVTHKMTIVTQKGQTSETVVNESKTRKHFRVVSVDSAKVAVLEPFIDRVQMTAQFGENDPIVYDSQTGKAPTAFRAVHESVGKPLARIKVAANGKLILAIPLRSIQRPAGKSQSRNAGPTSDASQNFLVVFPDKPIRVGDKWEDKIVVKVSVTAKLKRDVKLLRKYQLVSVENDLATISLKTAVLTPIRAAGARAQLIQRTPSGRIMFDLQQGLIVSRKLTIDKVEIGVFGADSSMRARSNRTEKLIEAANVARKSRSNASSGSTDKQ